MLAGFGTAMTASKKQVNINGPEKSKTLHASYMLHCFQPLLNHTCAIFLLIVLLRSLFLPQINVFS